MKKTYLILCIIGFILPNILVTIESFETGNILLYMNPVATFQDMFANRISSIFAIDLLFAVVVFFLWSYREAQLQQIKNLWSVWALPCSWAWLEGSLCFFICEKGLRSSRI